jgi:AraC-like DNA-binding protein
MPLDLTPRSPTRDDAFTATDSSASLLTSLVRQQGARAALPAPLPSGTAVVTVLAPHERMRVDAAGEGCYRTLHRESIDEVLGDLRHCRAQAVLVSVARCDASAVSSMARLVREFPAIPAVALLSDAHPNATQTLLSLGHYGVQSLVDVRDASGWRALRQLFSSKTRASIERLAVARVAVELAEAPEDCRRFFEGCFLAPPRVGTVRQLSRRLGVGASTLMSRFYRAALPAPKRYLAYARLVRAASLFENPGLSVSLVANGLEFSSPQSFGRHIQTMLGIPAMTFRREFDGARMLDRFVADLIVPHMATLRHFRPLVVLPTWTRESAAPPTVTMPTARRSRRAPSSLDAAPGASHRPAA